MDSFESALLKLGELLNDVETAVISSPLKKSNEIKKIKIEKIDSKGSIVYRFSRFSDNKVYHESCGFDTLIKKMLGTMAEEGFKQCFVTGDRILTILMNKTKQFKITGVKDNVNYSVFSAKEHNKRKNYILKDKAVPWMIQLGLMDNDGNVISSMQKNTDR